MACCVVAFRDENVVVDTTFQWLIKWYGGPHELFFDSAETLEAWLKLKVVI